MLRVCLSEAELIEVTGDAHAQAGSQGKKKNPTALNLLYAQHTAKKKISALSSNTNNTHQLSHTHTNTKRQMRLICDQTEAFNPRI